MQRVANHIHNHNHSLEIMGGGDGAIRLKENNFQIRGDAEKKKKLK